MITATVLPPCYKDLIAWPTLQYCRKRMCLALLYKSIDGLLALMIPSYFTPILTNTRIHHQSYHFSHFSTDATYNTFLSHQSYT